MKTILLTSVCLLAMPGIALAQATPTAAADEGIDRNEIVVTATKRSQVLSDVPISVSAVSAEQLKNSGGSDIRQLNQLAPSLLVSSATNESSGVARIRGIGTVGENPGLESSVAVFIDGVYRSRTGVGLTELGEIDRVEVLRGPQGTLFGRNASSGLISIVTKKPSFDPTANAEASYGNFNYFRLQGSATGPLIADKLAARLDGVYVKRDGFLKDSISGRSTANRDRFLFRGQLLFKPTEDVNIRIIGDYNQKKEECCGAAFLEPIQNLTRNAAGEVIQSPNTLLPVIQALGGVINRPTDGSKYSRINSITPGKDFHQNSKDYGLSGEVNWDLGAAELTSITAYRVYDSNNGQDSDFESLDIFGRTSQNRRFETFTQELRLQGKAFGDRVDYLFGGYYAHETLTTKDNFKYGADYERYANCVLAEGQARGLGIPSLLNTADSSCFNRAVAANIPSATIRGLAGLSPLGAGGFDPRGGFYNIAAAIGYVPPVGSNLLNGTGALDGGFFKQTSNNYAFFTHNVVSIVPDKVLLTLGLRYTNEKKDLNSVFRSDNNFCAALRATPLAAFAGLPCVVNNSAGPGFNKGDLGTQKKEDEFSGTAVLSVKPTERLLAYLSYSRGYKAGGFNLDTSALDVPNAALAASRPIGTTANGRAEATDLQFAPEIVDAFEVGVKLNLREFKLNATVFYESFNNFQLNTFNGINFEVTNLASCKTDLGGLDRDNIAGNSACAPGQVKAGVVSKGLELEAYLYPTNDISISTGLTYAKTAYRNNLTGLNGVSLATTLFQLPGQQLSNASEYVFTSSFAWTPQITEKLSGLAYVDFRYQSKYNTGSDLDFEKFQPGFGVVNARLGVYGENRRWGIELWAQNLLNEKYQQVAADAPAQGGGTLRNTARNGGAPANQLFITFPSEPRTFGVTVRTKF